MEIHILKGLERPAIVGGIFNRTALHRRGAAAITWPDTPVAGSASLASVRE